MKLYFTKLATGIIIKSGGKQFISRNFDTAFSLNYISHFNKVDLITSEDATNFELIKKILISGKYEVFLKDNYVDVLNNLKTLKSSISHKKENMIDRELLLRINEALEYVSFHNRTKEDHFNLSGIINEQSTFKVYNSVKKLFNLNNKDIINNHSAKNNRLIYFYTSIFQNSSFLKFFSKTIVASIVFRFLYSDITFYLGSYMFYPTLALYTLLLYKKYDKEIMNSNLVKSLRFNKSLEEITIEYYPKNIPIVMKNTMKANDCTLEHKTCDNKEMFIITTANNSFILPVDPIRSQIDSVLLKEIFRVKRDPLFYSAVVAKNKGFILDCPYTSNPNSSLDLLLRESLLNEKEPNFSANLTPFEIREKLLSLSDKEVEEHKDKINVSNKDHNLDKIESFLSSFGVLQSNEATRFLNETFYVESLNHLKNLGDYELNCLAKHIGLLSSEVDNLRSSLKEINN